MLKDLLEKITLAPAADRRLSSSDDYSDVLPDTCRMPLFQPQTGACWLEKVPYDKFHNGFFVLASLITGYLIPLHEE